jgi:hypothetical protein
MEELNLINNQQGMELWKALEQNTGLLLPRDKEHFGEVSFHVYVRTRTDFEKNDNEYVFHIRWGMHKIFSEKHLCLKNPAECLDDLIKVIKSNKNQIKIKLIEYIEGQLGSIVTLELEPAFNQKFSSLRLYEIKVDRGRNKNNVSHGWPNICIFISWYDEFGYFQEFIYPIRLYRETRCFRIPIPEIITQFQRYRDSLV